MEPERDFKSGTLSMSACFDSASFKTWPGFASRSQKCSEFKSYILSTVNQLPGLWI